MNSRAILLVDIFLSAGSSFVTLLFVDNFIIDLVPLNLCLGHDWDMPDQFFGILGVEREP